MNEIYSLVIYISEGYTISIGLSRSKATMTTKTAVNIGPGTGTKEAQYNLEKVSMDHFYTGIPIPFVSVLVYCVKTTM